MFSWLNKKKSIEQTVAPPPPPQSGAAPPAPRAVPRSPVQEHFERLPPLPFEEAPRPAPQAAVLPSLPRPTPPIIVQNPPLHRIEDAELESLRASIDAAIAHRNREKLMDQLSLDLKATAPFYAADGSHFTTIRELANAALVMDENTFNHHVTSDRNDFCNWLEHCFDEQAKTVGQMLRSRTRQEWAALFNHALSPARNPQEQPSVQVPQPVRVPTFNPLPPPPPQARVNNVQQVQDLIVAAERQLAIDKIVARDMFIAARTRIWQDLSDEERKQVLPQLRAAYEKIRAK